MAISAARSKASSTRRLSDNVALRVVAWYRHDAGYIDNVPGTPHLPDARRHHHQQRALVEEDYNDVDTYGARAALGSSSTTIGR